MSKHQLTFKEDAVVTVWYKPAKGDTPCDV